MKLEAGRGIAATNNPRRTLNLFRVLFAAVVLAMANAAAQSTTTVDWSNSASTSFKDSAGSPLSQGAATNKDGMLVQLGYFTGATPAHKFAGDWVPITGVIGLPRTAIGDSPANTGLGNGRIGFNTFFIANSADVQVFDPADAGQYATRSSLTITSTTPPDQQLLAIRFYDTSDGASGHYNTVTSDSWVWNAPTPVSPIVTIELADPSDPKLVFEDNANRFKTSLPVPTPPPSPTPTPTPSLTPVPSPTPSPTSTPSPSPSPTATPTATPTPSATATPTPTPTLARVSQLLNLSARKVVGSGNDVTIGGFIITGSDKKTVLVRGLGPSLAPPFPANAVLADPTLELRQADQTLLALNNDWQESQAIEIRATGIAPGNSLEAAIVHSLPAKPAAQGGAGYTAILAGKNGGTGQGLLELYDLDQVANSRLANISTRGFVGTGDNLLIGGFFPGPLGNGPLKVLIRALGPSLAKAGVSDPLTDPLLELHDSNGNVVGQPNDNWQEAPNANQIASILPPTDPHESAILVTLSPSEHGYTAVVRSANNATGVALVEIYALP